MRTRSVVLFAFTMLAGYVPIGWAIYGLLTTVVPMGGSCGYDPSQPCPSNTTWHALAFGVGLLVSIISAFHTRYGHGGAFVAVGLGSLCAAISIGAERDVWLLFFSGSFLVIGLLLMAIPTGAQQERQKRRPARKRVAEAPGAVLTATDIGTVVDGDWRTTVHFRGVVLDAPKTTEEPEATTGARTFQINVDPIDQLTKLNELRSAGVLTEEEFQVYKTRIIDRS